MSKKPKKKLLKAHEGWVLEEKRHLLEALKTHGHENLDVLQKVVPNKSKKAVEKYLNHFKKCALWNMRSDITDLTHIDRPQRTFVGCQNVDIPDNSPISQWIKVFGSKSKSLNPTLSIALKLIAQLENHPTPEECSGVNLKDLYMYLGDSLNGEYPDAVDVKSMRLLTCSLIDLATKTKKNRNPEVFDYVQQITSIRHETPATLNSGDSVNSLPEPFRELQTSSTYNPLWLSAQVLKKDPNV